MTQEEAKKIIEYTFLNADGHLKPLDFDYEGGKGIVEALRMTIEALSKPSIPSNINEAAQKVEDYYDVGEEHGYLCCHRGDIKNAFKAGAEWMAGQFHKIEGELVDWYSTSDGKEYCCGVKTNDAFEVSEGFYIKKK